MYTVGDSRKFVAVGLGRVAGLRSAAVFGCRWEDAAVEGGIAGDSDRGNKV